MVVGTKALFVVDWVALPDSEAEVLGVAYTARVELDVVEAVYAAIVDGATA